MPKKIKGHPRQHASSGPFSKHLQEPPITDKYQGSGKLAGQVALISGADSGIGRSVALHYAREGAQVGVMYQSSDTDAQDTAEMLRGEGCEPLLIKGDISKAAFCKRAVERVIKKYGKLDILVNNAGIHEQDKKLEEVTNAQLHKTFEVNVYGPFYLTRAALEHMEKGGVIINTVSVVAYRGSDHLMDYAATKGALLSFTRSLSANLAQKQIRVNAVAPGPIWTPLVTAAFPAAHLKEFGKKTPLGRAGYPREVAPAYVFLASADSSYITGQVIHVNGGEVVGS